MSQNPYCLENFDLFLQNIGGAYVFAIMIITTFLIIIFMVVFVSQKRNNKFLSIEKLIEQADKAMKDP